MKTPSKHLINAVIATTTTGICTGIIIPSCNYHDQIFLKEDLPQLGLHAIELGLSKEDLDYLNFINKLGKDIIDHPVIAQEFSKNPQLFLERYGYKVSINLDESMLKLILALGDEEINTAINVGDIKNVIMLMEEKGLLENMDTTSSIEISDDKKKELLSLMGFNNNEIEYYACTPPVFYCGAVLIAAVVAFVGMYVGGVTLAGAAVGVGTWAGVWTEVATYGSNNNSSFIEKNPSLKIWALKGNPNDTYIAANFYAEDLVSKVMETIKSYNMEQYNYDEEKLKNFLKLNIIHN